LPFELSIVTPQGQAFSGAVDRVVLPGSEGEFTVLPQHERFLTPLRVGHAVIHRGSETLHAALSEGFAEVRGDAVSVLVESCELAGDIDQARAEHARARAEQGLAALPADAERARFEEFEAALARARNRLAVAGRKR
jgi:F-type H+-transporting ATPase subunit epsilon